MASPRAIDPCQRGTRQAHRGVELCLGALLGALIAAPALAGPAAYSLSFGPPTPVPPIVSESDGMMMVGVNLLDDCGGPFTPVTWDVTLIAGSADPSDYGPPSTTSLVFSFTQLTQTFMIPIVDDGVTEGSETFDIKLSPNGIVDLDCANPSQPPSMPEFGLTVTIEDEPDGLLEIKVDDAIAPENNGTMTFNVRIPDPNPGPGPLTVDWSTADGTALAGEDYVAATGQASFSPGDAVTQIVIGLVDDGVVEPPETFLVHISNPSAGGQIVDSEGTGTIQDDDVAPPPELSIDDVMVIEGDQGTTDATFTVTLDPGSTTAGSVVTVDYATDDGTATTEDNDYLPVSGQLTFQPGETAHTVTVAVVGDTRIEPDEGFFVELSNPDGAVIEVARGRGGILDDDAEEPPVLAISDTVVDEGDEGETQAVFEVTLSRPSTMTVEVSFETMDGTATAGEDYRASTGTVELMPGETAATVEVAVFGDTEVEANELFLVQLSGEVGAVIGDGGGRGIIRNDDEGGGGGDPDQVRFVRDRQSAMEGTGNAEVAVERVGDGEGAAQVTVTPQAGTAQPDADFTPLRTVLRWQPGELGRKLYRLPIVDDNAREDAETLRLRLSEPTGAELATPDNLLLTIVDDDTPMKLEAVGDQEVTARVREDFELVVRASRMDGSPVAGTIVTWRAEGRAEVVGPEERETDDEGLSRVTIRPNALPGQAVVVARLLGTDSAVSFAITVEGNLSGEGGGNSGAGEGEDRDVGQLLDGACVDATGDLLAICELLFGISDPGDRQQALDAITPRGAIAQGNAALRAPRIQLRNIGGRLNALRGSGARIAADQLAVSVQGDTFAVGTVRQAVSAYRLPEDAFVQALDDALHGRTPREGPRGGGASADQPAPDTESPWGFFVNGRASFGDAPRTSLESGYDFETQGLTAGVDYRLGDRFVLGAGLGYLATAVDVAADGGSLDVTGTSLSLYATYFRDSFYVDGVLVYGRNDYELSRVINLPRAFQGQTRLIARGEPEGDQLSVDLGFGYDFRIGAASLGGFLRASLVDASVDAFAETGAGPLDLLFSSQEIESLQTEAGLELSYPTSFRWGVLQPSLRLSYLHEFEDDSRLIRAGFRADPAARRFAVRSDTPDRDFFNLGAGLTATLPRSMATYLLFDTDLERDDFDVYTFSGGFRWQF